MAKAKNCERCGRRFLAEANEPQLCIMCLADENLIEETTDDDKGRDPIDVSYRDE